MTAIPATEHRFLVTPTSGEVTGFLVAPPNARVLYVFGHGAGAGARHAFMETAAHGLSGHGIATFRYNFPYKEQGRKAPNPARVLVETVRAAVAEAARLAPDLPLFAGGKSMGGRMTSTAAAQEPLAGVRGLAFFGFPLHGIGKPPSAERGAHLAEVGLPMLFIQGTRDKLADLSLLTPLLDSVSPQPTLHVVDGADHGFHVLKRSGRTGDEVSEELCAAFARWVTTIR